jgi:hypothetical protein
MKTIELKKKTIVELSVLITEESNINESAFYNSLIETIKKEFHRNKKHPYIDFESLQCFENNQIVVREILRNCIESKVDRIYTINGLLSISIKFVKGDNDQEFLNIELYNLVPVTLSDNELYKLVPATLSDDSDDIPTVRKSFLHLNTDSLHRRLMSYLEKGGDR